MQSSAAKRSQLWSCQRSGDHEETVQVPYTQRVCTQDKGTTLTISVFVSQLSAVNPHGFHEIVQVYLINAIYTCTYAFLEILIYVLIFFFLISCFKLL